MKGLGLSLHGYLPAYAVSQSYIWNLYFPVGVRRSLLHNDLAFPSNFRGFWCAKEPDEKDSFLSGIKDLFIVWMNLGHDGGAL